MSTHTSTRRGFPKIFLLVFLIYAAQVFGQSLLFEDVTKPSGITGPKLGYGHGVAAGDFNSDGLVDFYVVAYATRNQLFINQGDDTFVEMAEGAGVQGPDSLWDRGVSAADFDNDGDLDIYVAAAGSHPNQFFRNNGNLTFTEIARRDTLRLLPHNGQGVSWGDYDNDGMLDLFLAGFASHSFLMQQTSSGIFINRTEAAGVPGIDQAVQSVFFDLDGDKDLDLFISRGQGADNQLLINLGNGRFDNRAVSFRIDDPEPHGQGVAVADYDGDGDFDIYMSSDNSANRLYRNDGGRFTEVAKEAGVNDRSRSLGCHFADFDNDGWQDLYVVNFGINQLYRNNSDGTFTKIDTSAHAGHNGRGYGSAVVDYDNDGRLDIFISNSGHPNALLRNLTTTTNHWLRVKLRGHKSNRDGIGAHVEVTAAGRRQVQQIISGFAMVSGGNDRSAHFGLGDNARADRVEIFWPSGTYDVLPKVVADQALFIEEGKHPIDTTPPAISNIVVDSLLHNRVWISWRTSEPATAQIEYGKTAALDKSTAKDSTFSTQHRIMLDSLQELTTYNYRVVSEDASDNRRLSPVMRFTTAARDQRAPEIETITVAEVQGASVVLLWQTDEPASSWVEYSADSSFGNVAGDDQVNSATHKVALANLLPETNYHFRLRSADRAGNTVVSEDLQFRTGSLPLCHDDFNDKLFDEAKWVRSTNSSSRVEQENGRLTLQATSVVNSGWVVTRDRYVGTNRIVRLRVVQASGNTTLGISPTLDAGAPNGIFDEPNWYRFGIRRPAVQAPYTLFVNVSKSRLVEQHEMQPQHVLTRNFFLQIRTRVDSVFFEYSIDGFAWIVAHAERFSLPGYTLGNQYHFEIAAQNTSAEVPQLVDDFLIHEIDSQFLPPIAVYEFPGAGWYCIALSVITEKNDVAELFPQATAALRWNSEQARFTQITKLPLHEAFWLLVPTPATVEISGTPIVWYQKRLENSGWHQLGAASLPSGLISRPAGSVTSPFTWNPNNERYLNASLSNLQPNIGYWLFAKSAPVTITVGVGVAPSAVVDAKSGEYAMQAQDIAGLQPPMPPTSPASQATVQPQRFRLKQNYPNPFNAGTIIEFDLPEAGEVRVKIFSMAGVEIATLIEGKLAAGVHRVRWQGANEAGELVQSGIYLCRLEAGDVVEARKMIYIR